MLECVDAEGCPGPTGTGRAARASQGPCCLCKPLLAASGNLSCDQVQFPPSDREHFHADVNQQVDTMITRAKGTLAYEDPKKEKVPSSFRLCWASSLG